MSDAAFFNEGFVALTGKCPFGWQQRLFADFMADRPDAPRIAQSLDIPTGLGKTSVIVVWLLALAARAEAGAPPLPRRLVYVVDRRTVVDQATSVAERIRAEVQNDGATGSARRVRQALETLCVSLRVNAHNLASPIAISTLRGELADNREWQADPVRPAIIIGTVDMIGSRLLFSGYGVSRRMRPYHAGLIGADAFVALDEAHLVPPFQALLTGVRDLHADSGHHLVPPLRVMTLSATGRNSDGRAFGLEPEDAADPVVTRRLNACKALKLEEQADPRGLAGAMADRAWAHGEGGRRVIVFCDSRKIAQETYGLIAKRLGKAAKPGTNIELIVGARRAHEREGLASSEVFRRFSPSGSASTDDADTAAEAPGPAFLVATSAGEVGIDLDADHMVCDLVAWERMVQRLGRVNRMGDFPASLVDVFVASSEKDKDAETPAGSDRLALWRKPFESSLWPPDEGGRRDASPAALRRLRDNADFARLIEAATTPAPLHPALTRALIDAWSMTSLEEHPGRPDVAPWIRGWVDDEPQTRMIWRGLLPVRSYEPRMMARQALAEFFEAAPPHMSEALEDRTWVVVKLLQERAKAILKSQETDRMDRSEPSGGPRNGLGSVSVAAIVLSMSHDVEDVLELRDIERTETRHLEARLRGRTVVLDARVGGLDDAGLIDAKESEPPTTFDGDPGPAGAWTDDQIKAIGFRVRMVRHDTMDTAEWRAVWARLVAARDEDDEDIGSAAEWRVEEWVGEPTEKIEPALARTKQGLAEHQSLAARWAEAIGLRAGLPESERRMLVASAALHDAGKARRNWQAYAGNPGFARNPETHPPLAKFTTRSNPALLRIGDKTYRHEFGSLRDATGPNGLRDIDDDLRDLALHLIAAHHGNARPVIAPVDEACPPAASAELARQAALRFARLQRRWGPWGLAWLEALLRAADVGASREVDRAEEAG